MVHNSNIEPLNLEDVKDVNELYGLWCAGVQYSAYHKFDPVALKATLAYSEGIGAAYREIAFREDGKFYCESNGKFNFKGDFKFDGDTVVLTITRSVQWLTEEEKTTSYKVKKGNGLLVLVNEDSSKNIGPFIKSKKPGSCLQKSLAALVNEKEQEHYPFSGSSSEEEDAHYFDIEDYLEQIKDFDGGKEELSGFWATSEILFQCLVPKEQIGPDMLFFYIIESLKKRAFHFKADATCYYCNLGDESVLKGIYDLDGNVATLNVKQVAKWENNVPKERFNYVESAGQKKLTLKVDEEHGLLIAVEQDEQYLVAYLLERNDEPVASYMVFNFVEDFEGTPDDLVGRWKTTKVMSDYHLPKEDIKEGMIDAMDIEIYKREYYFNPDGSVIFKTGNGTVLFGQYGLDETELTLNVLPAGSEGQEQTIRYKLMQEDCNIVIVEQCQDYIIYAVLSKEVEEDGESEENRPKKNQRYEYEGACSAPRLYAAEVLHAELIVSIQYKTCLRP